MPSVTCLRCEISALLLVYSFQFKPAFLPRRSARWHSDIRSLPNIGHRTSPKIRGGFLYGEYRPGNHFELIPAIKMETRHPVEGSLDSEFSAIIITELWRSEIAKHPTQKSQSLYCIALFSVNE